MQKTIFFISLNLSLLFFLFCFVVVGVAVPKKLFAQLAKVTGPEITKFVWNLSPNLLAHLFDSFIYLFIRKLVLNEDYVKHVCVPLARCQKDIYQTFKSLLVLPSEECCDDSSLSTV